MANLLHSKGSRTQIYKTLPSNDVGNDGDIILSQIQGRGVYLCSKVNGRWHVSSKMEELRKIENTSTKDLTTNKLRVLDNLAIGRGTTTITKDEAKFTSSLKIKEASNAISDTVEYGQLWVKTATPNELYFTTDAGNDIQLTSGTSAAGGSSTTFRFLINAGFNASYDEDQIWIPLSARDLERRITQTGQNELLAFTPPYDGYLNQVVFRSEEACGSTVVGLHRSATGTEIPNQTASNTVTVDMSADDTPYKFAFGSSASFSAGEILGISMNPTNDPNDTVFTVEFIFDSSSGL